MTRFTALFTALTAAANVHVGTRSVRFHDRGELLADLLRAPGAAVEATDDWEAVNELHLTAGQIGIAFGSLEQKLPLPFVTLEHTQNTLEAYWNWSLIGGLLLATGYLAWLGIRGECVGPLLWPAVVLHAAVTILLGRAWLKSPKPGGENNHAGEP